MFKAVLVELAKF